MEGFIKVPHSISEKLKDDTEYGHFVRLAQRMVVDGICNNSAYIDPKSDQFGMITTPRDELARRWCKSSKSVSRYLEKCLQLGLLTVRNVSSKSGADRLQRVQYFIKDFKEYNGFVSPDRLQPVLQTASSVSTNVSPTCPPTPPNMPSTHIDRVVFEERIKKEECIIVEGAKLADAKIQQLNQVGLAPDIQASKIDCVQEISQVDDMANNPHYNAERNPTGRDHSYYDQKDNWVPAKEGTPEYDSDLLYFAKSIIWCHYRTALDNGIRKSVEIPKEDMGATIKILKGKIKKLGCGDLAYGAQIILAVSYESVVQNMNEQSLEYKHPSFKNILMNGRFGELLHVVSNSIDREHFDKVWPISRTWSPKDIEHEYYLRLTLAKSRVEMRKQIYDTMQKSGRLPINWEKIFNKQGILMVKDLSWYWPKYKEDLPKFDESILRFQNFLDQD